MLLSCSGLFELFVIRTLGSVSRKVQVPPLPLIDGWVGLVASSGARKTTSPGPGFVMSLTTIVGLEIVPDVRWVCPVPSLT